MARTKKDGTKVGGKRNKGGVSKPPRNSSTSKKSTKALALKNSVVKRDVPDWQKPITGFYKKDAKYQDVVELDEDGVELDQDVMELEQGQDVVELDETSEESSEEESLDINQPGCSGANNHRDIVVEDGEIDEAEPEKEVAGEVNQENDIVVEDGEIDEAKPEKEVAGEVNQEKETNTNESEVDEVNKIESETEIADEVDQEKKKADSEETKEEEINEKESEGEVLDEVNQENQSIAAGTVPEVDEKIIEDTEKPDEEVEAKEKSEDVNQMDSI